MCVAAIAWDAHPDWLLVAIGNRDEFFERPAAPLSRWPDGSGIIAGRDLKEGGTWLGVSEVGRFALLTNFRDPDGFVPGRPSRGALVTDYLAGRPVTQAPAMNPFNLFRAQPGHGAEFVTNYPWLQKEPMRAGIHGMSNGPLGQPWPKTRQLCSALDAWLACGKADFAALFAALRSETPRPADQAPVHAPAPAYAPVFIRNATYGTRCSTVTAIARDGHGVIIERSFDPGGVEAGERKVAFRWPEMR